MFANAYIRRYWSFYCPESCIFCNAITLRLRQYFSIKNILLCIPFLLCLLSFQRPEKNNDENLGIFLDKFRLSTADEIEVSSLTIPVGAGDLTVRMIDEAHRLVQDTFKHSSAGALEPAQQRILYVYGGKEYSIRTVYLQDRCNLRLYGLDCSGFIRQLFVGSGLKDFPIRNANTIRQVSFLKIELPGYKVTDLKNIPMEDFRSGDLIYFKETADSKLSNHVGLIVKDQKGNISMYHCSGWKNACEHNISARGGVRSVHLTPLLNQHWYGIIRISAV